MITFYLLYPVRIFRYSSTFSYAVCVFCTYTCTVLFYLQLRRVGITCSLPHTCRTSWTALAGRIRNLGTTRASSMTARVEKK